MVDGYIPNNLQHESLPFPYCRWVATFFNMILGSRPGDIPYRLPTTCTGPWTACVFSFESYLHRYSTRWFNLRFVPFLWDILRSTRFWPFLCTNQYYGSDILLLLFIRLFFFSTDTFAVLGLPSRSTKSAGSMPVISLEQAQHGNHVGPSVEPFYPSLLV